MNIKELRESRNLSQQELADKTGIPKARIAKWEQGKGTPKIDDYMALKEFFEEFVPRDTNQNVLREAINKPQSLSEQINFNLSESIRIQAIANQQRAEADNRNAQNTSEMIAMIKSTVNADQQISEDLVATVVGLRNYLIELVGELKNQEQIAIGQEIDKKVMDAKNLVGNKGRLVGANS